MTNDNAKSLSVEPLLSSAESRPSDEPFACPHCGQMLAASCRVCVACHEPVTAPPAPKPLPPPVVQPAAPQEAHFLEPVRFPWLLLLALFGACVLATSFAINAGGLGTAQEILVFLWIVTPVWILFDAWKRRVPKPLFWTAAALIPLLWLPVLAWYIRRRQAPERPCSFESNPAWKAILLFLAVGYLVLGFTGAGVRFANRMKRMVQRSSRINPR